MTRVDPVADLLGGTDIYLLDQLLRGRVVPGMRVLDVGCGHGRNLAYLMQAGYAVGGADPDQDAIAAVRRLAAARAPGLPPENFRCEAAEALTFPDGWADVVIANAVFHFARDETHFRAMVAGAWRVLQPGGLWFARLATTIGMEELVEPLGGRRFRQPDGDARFLADAPLLREISDALGASWADPLKTTVVDGRRAMTTWVLHKTADGGPR